MSKVGAIVFDFDGTIADSFLTALDVLYELTHRNEPLPDEDISRLRGMGPRQIFRELHIPLWKVPFLAMRARRRIRGRIGEIAIVPGMDEALRAMQKQYKLFVLSSNSAENVQLFLERYGIEACFLRIYGSVSPFRKSHTLRKLLAENGFILGETWYVGDEVRDMAAAHQAGMKAMGVSWGYNNIHALEGQHPEALVFSPDELRRCFLDNSHSKNG